MSEQIWKKSWLNAEKKNIHLDFRCFAHENAIDNFIKIIIIIIESYNINSNDCVWAQHFVVAEVFTERTDFWISSRSPGRRTTAVEVLVAASRSSSPYWLTRSGPGWRRRSRSCTSVRRWNHSIGSSSPDERFRVQVEGRSKDSSKSPCGTF